MLRTTKFDVVSYETSVSSKKDYNDRLVLQVKFPQKCFSKLERYTK